MIFDRLRYFCSKSYTPRQGAADGCSLSRPHRDLRSRDFPAVRDEENFNAITTAPDGFN